jgi:hypothetical protein
MEYIVNDYIESGYFETSIVGIQGEAAIVASFSAAAELLDISDGGNDYLDATYVNPGYFEYVAPAAAVIEGAGVLLHNAQISVTANKIVEAVSNQTALASIVVTGGKNVEINLVAYSLGGMITAADKFHGIVQTLVSTTQQTANGGILVLGEAGSISNTYVDSDYIINSYFDGTLTGGLVSFFTQSALVGKRQLGVIGNLSNDYVDPTYLDGGYFFGVSDVIISATLVGDLELVETGFIEGSALLASAFASNQIATRQREAQAQSVSVFNFSITSTKVLESISNISADFASSSQAQRTRSTSSSIESQSSISTLNSRIRNNASVMSSEFQTTTFGQRARAIDLYAFTNGGLVAQASVIRDSNTLANTFFNVGTDFIRTRNVSAEGDATVFISNIPTRIRDTSLETQDAFSFASTVVATRRISQSMVASFNSESQGRLIKGYTSNVSVQSTLDITPNVTRLFDSNITSTATQISTPSITRGFESTQSATFTQQSVISAIFGCDMIAFDDAEVITRGNAIFRFSCDMFSMPGAAILAIPTKIHPGSCITSSNFSVIPTGVKIHPFIANTFEVNSFSTTTFIRYRNHNGDLQSGGILNADGNVNANILPVTFYVWNNDEAPLAYTLESRTRETGVNI